MKNGPKVPKRDNAQQSWEFIKKAREIGADEDKSAADELLGQLAKLPPEPRIKRSKIIVSTVQEAIDWICANSPSLDATVYVSNPLSISVPQEPKTKSAPLANRASWRIVLLI